MRSLFLKHKWLLHKRFPTVAIPALFFVIFGITALIIHNQIRDLKNQASVSDRTVTSLLSDYLLQTAANDQGTPMKGQFLSEGQGISNDRH